MADEDVPASLPAERPMVEPSYLLMVGLAGAVLALALAFTGVWVPLRVLVLGVGILAGAGAVNVRPKDARVLAGAALIAVLSAWGMDGSQLQLWFRNPNDDWDSARLVMYVLAAVALAGLFLVCLPQITGRVFRVWEHTFTSQRAPDLKAAEEFGRSVGRGLSRAIVSLLVVLHFVGIVSAVLTVPPTGNREPSWMASQVWLRWQPYLQFLYLNNAYRFYSPEPGPPSLLWFRVEYADGSYRWIKLPTRDEDSKDPLAVEFTRRLSLGNAADQVQFVPGIPDSIRQKRMAARSIGIPPHPEFPLDMQYRPLQENSQRLVREFARYVAQTYPHDKADLPVTGVKVYVVVHRILEPRQMASENIRPTEKWTYMPYYVGEFTQDGELKDPDDPLLYWLIPRFAWPKGLPYNPLAEAPPGLLYLESIEYDVKDYLEDHGKTKTVEKRRP